jgi:hypothetical protein
MVAAEKEVSMSCKKSPEKERKIFFCRHGYQEGGHVSAEGWRKLAVLRAWLEERDFKAEHAISSPSPRSVETAEYLMYGGTPLIMSELNAYTNWGVVYVKNNPCENSLSSKITPHHAQEYVINMVPNILIEFEDLEKDSDASDLIVVCHSFVPLRLAWHYLALRGLFLPSDVGKVPDFPSFPYPGEGILVQGTEYEFFKHPSISKTRRNFMPA